MSEETGRVLVISCSSFLSSKDVISEMLATDVPEPIQLSDGLEAYPWKIENKYYTADIQLCSCAASSIPAQCEFATNVNFQSVIIIFDRNEKSSFKEARTWLPYIESQDPSVLLLINSGKGSEKEALSRAEVVKWCLDNSFELVDMISEEDEEEDEDEEDAFREKTGIERVVEALQCADWPNMNMRENRSGKSRVTSKQDKSDSSVVNNGPPSEERRSSESNTSVSTGATAAAPEKVFSLPTDELELLSSLASDGAENESFEELFQKLAVMKERAATLPVDERKDYAEKVAMAFWRAMGGSEEEITGFTDDAP